MYKYTPLLLIIEEIGTKEILIQAVSELTLTGLKKGKNSFLKSKHEHAAPVVISEEAFKHYELDKDDIEDDPEEAAWDTTFLEQADSIDIDVDFRAMGTLHSIRSEMTQDLNPLLGYEHSVAEVAEDYPDGYYLLFPAGYVLYRNADELYDAWALNGEFEVVSKKKINTMRLSNYSRRRIYPEGYHFL